MSHLHFYKEHNTMITFMRRLCNGDIQFANYNEEINLYLHSVQRPYISNLWPVIVKLVVFSKVST